MKEKIAVVDLNDEILDVIFRSDLNKKMQIYRTVGAFIIFDDGTILVQRRALNKKTHAGKWDISSVAGYVQAGESYSDAIIRETEEEIGLRLDNPTFISKLLSDNAYGGRRFSANFAFFVPNELKKMIKISDREVAEINFLTIDEILDDFTKEREKYAYYAESLIEILTNFLKETR